MHRDKNVLFVDAGQMQYRQAFQFQTVMNRWLQVHRDIPGFLVVVEHPPVFTIGRNRRSDDFLFSVEWVKTQGIDVVESNRGGNVTYHGPGQIVAYPLLNLEHFRKNVKEYVWNLEEWMIHTLEAVGLDADRKAEYRGVWVGDDKIGALGVAVKRWTTMHGVALNHEPMLEHFQMINPCGITEYGVTSLEKLGIRLQREKLVRVMMRAFENVFRCSLQEIPLEEVMNRVGFQKA